jgi:cytochrome c553
MKAGRAWLAIGAVFLAAPIHAGDAAAGRQKAGSCVACHGAAGLSTLPNAPNLAGQPEIYLVEQLRAYRNGKRANEVMTVVARALSDRDIDDLAAWYGLYQDRGQAPGLTRGYAARYRWRVLTVPNLPRCPAASARRWRSSSC